MKTILRFLLCVYASFCAHNAYSQFGSNVSNLQISGTNNHLLSGGNLTFDSGSVLFLKSNSATTNQLLFVSDTNGTVKPLTLGTNLSITGTTLNGTAFDPNAIQTLTNKTINGGSNTLTIRAASDITGVLPVANGGTNITSGTSGGIPYFSSNSTIAASALLATSQLMVGGGAGSSPVTLGSLGTATTVLHGNAAGLPSFSAVDATGDITGILPAGNGGTNNGFTQFTGPATTTKTFTLPNATTTILTTNAAVTPAQGGTGLATLTANNIILGAGTGNVTFLAPGSSGNVVTSNGTVWTSAAAATGNVTGPGSSTADNIVTWSGTAGTAIKNTSGITASSGTITSASDLGLIAASGNVSITPSGANRVKITQSQNASIGMVTTNVNAGVSASAELQFTNNLGDAFYGLGGGNNSTTFIANYLYIYTPSTANGISLWANGAAKQYVTSTGTHFLDNAATETIGKTFAVKSGSNAKSGTFTLSSGAATLSNSSITANSVLVCWLKTASGAITAAPYATAVSVGTSFTIAAGVGDNSTYNFIIFEVN